MTATPAPVVAAPAPVVEYILLAPTFQTAPTTMTVTGVDMNRDGIPDVLQQPQVGHGAPVLYGALVGAPTIQTVTAQPGYQYGAPQEVQCGDAMFRGTEIQRKCVLDCLCAKLPSVSALLHELAALVLELRTEMTMPILRRALSAGQHARPWTMWRRKQCSVLTLSWTAGACSVSFARSFFLSLTMPILRRALSGRLVPALP